MNKFIIAYDLYNPGQKWAQLDAAIPKLGKAAKILRTTWTLRTNLTHQQVGNQLETLIDSNDKLAVLAVTGAGTAFGYTNAELAVLNGVLASA